MVELHDSRPTLTANSAGAVVMLAADSINAAHDVPGMTWFPVESSVAKRTEERFSE